MIMKRTSKNVAALEVTLSELERLGRLELIDSAAVQMVRSLAAALDDVPFKADLWRQYREALKELVADDSSSSVDDALDDLFSQVGDS